MASPKSPQRRDSHDITRTPHNIMDLPVDILNSVFEHFREQNYAPDQWSYTDCHADANDITRQTVHNSRLVNRAFHDIATPLLSPILRVQLDEASLDRMERVSQIPHLAHYVRGIQVVLHYRPKEVANNFALYKACRKKEVQKSESTCDYYGETWTLGGYDEDDETVCPLPYAAYQKAMNCYNDIRAAWDDAVDRPEEYDKDEEYEEDDSYGVYQRMLHEGYEAYQKKHEEQFHLISDGSFANRFAASMARMPNADTIGFIDRIDQIPDPYFQDPTLLLTNKEELRKIMPNPHSWATIEEMEANVELLPAKLLSELPIAIHKAGVTLKEVNIGCFPVKRGHAMVCPDRQSPNNPAWPELHKACQSLVKLDFGSGSMNNKPIRLDYLLDEEQNAMDEYLGAMLSGKCLETVQLSFYAFSTNDGRGAEKSHRIGKVLAAADWPRISRLTLSSIALRQVELEQFCKGLGPSMSYLYWWSMDLLDGSWAGGLDTLREKVGTRCVEGRCEVRLSSLTGGDFEKLKNRERVNFWEVKAWEPEPEPTIVQDSLGYISGKRTENPVRENQYRKSTQLT